MTRYASGGRWGARRPMTNRRMFLTMLLGAILRRRSRVLAATLSSAVGAATLFCLAAVCLAVPAQMSAQIRQFGANLIVVPVAQEAQSVRMDARTAQAAVSAVASTIGVQPDDVRWAAYRYETVRVNRSPYLLAGVNIADVRRLNGHWSVDGRWPGQGEVLVGKDVAEAAGLRIGSTVTAEYQSSDNLQLDNSHLQDSSSQQDSHPAGAPEGTSSQGPAPAEETASADGHSGHSGHDHGGGSGTSSQGASDEEAAGSTAWRVSGIVDTGGKEDDILYVSADAVDSLTGTQQVGYDVIEMSADTSSASMNDVVAAVEEAGGSIQAQPVSKITSGDTRIVTMLNMLFWVVSVIVLVLTLVGVSTTMTVIVAERRNEIGLRKALGASARSVAMEFYAEAALLGGIGGLLGAAVGYGMAVAICRGVFDMALALNWPLAAVAVILSAAVAVIASYSPVRRASRIDPALVLKGE